MDNTTAIAYINRMGGTSPWLARLVYEIWQWCLQREICLTAHPNAADRESRVDRDSSNLKLDPLVCAHLNELWGSLEVDLFMTRLTNQLPRYVTWRLDQEAEVTDTFSQDCSQIRGYTFPPFSLVGRCLPQVREQDTQHMVLVAPVWETHALVPSTVTSYCRFPPRLPKDSWLLSKEGSHHPLPQRQLAGRLVSGLFVSAWRNQNSSSYESAWRLWGSWFRQKEVDPFSASVQQVVNFLASLFADGKEHRTIIVYRSALFMTLRKVEGLNVGQHPLVCQVMKGIFQKKPPLLRYSATWDVSKVLIFIRSF